ncbi:MAG: porin [Gammaproteobacteria bacterium]|nr:porin [Gammaproteobacteria bacterium]
MRRKNPLRVQATTTSLIAIGVTTLAASSPALAGDVTLYGTMHYAWEYADTHDAAGDARDDATGTNHASLLGFEGREDLGDGYHAFFVLDSDIGANLGSNNTYVGIEGAFGSILLGQMDTPYKTSTIEWNIWGDTTGDYTAIIGADAAGNTSFDSFTPQAVGYVSPDMNGLRFAIARTALKANNGAGNKDDRAWSTSLTYSNGPLAAAIAYETHDGANLTAAGLGGSSNTASEKAWRAGAQYRLGNSLLAAVYEDIDHDNTTVRQSRAAWWLSFTQEVGNNALNVSYAQAGDSDVAGGGDGASQLTIGGQHFFSERTAIYALYSTVGNDTNASYGLQGGGFAASAAGRDVDAFSFGIVHNF